MRDVGLEASVLRFRFYVLVGFIYVFCIFIISGDYNRYLRVGSTYKLLVVFLCISNISNDYNRYLRVGNTYKR